MSAAHRMPPAQKSSSQHVKNRNSIFQNTLYVGFYALCPAHIECRQKHITTDVIIMLHVSAFLKKHCFEGLYKLIISYEIIALKSNLMRGCRAHSALGMQLIGWFLKGPPPLRNGKNMANKMFRKEIRWLHFFRLRCLLVQSKSNMNLSSWISDP